VRPCEMEARSESQHRTKVNLQAGCLTWASERGRATPYIRSRSCSSGGGSGETFLNLTPRDLSGSAHRGRTKEGNDRGPMPTEKSDHPILVTKPSNAGGAKGMTN
jgi:hypothetical protein